MFIILILPQLEFFQRSCLSCGHVQKGAKGKNEVLGSCLTEMAEKLIKDAAAILKDDAMLAKICGIHFPGTEVKNIITVAINHTLTQLIVLNLTQNPHQSAQY